MRDLYSRAVEYVDNDHEVDEIEATPCTWLYRDKDRKYFDDVFYSNAGVMKPTVKDRSGDQASAINDRLSGIFFMTKNFDGQPQEFSHFGNRRIQVRVIINDCTPRSLIR